VAATWRGRSDAQAYITGAISGVLETT